MILEYKIINIGIQPKLNGKTNIVAHVQWLLVVSRSGFSSTSFVDTLLPLGDLSNFTPIEQLTKQQILDWCIATEGGQVFIDGLIEHHERVITAEERRVGVELYTGPLAFELDTFKNQHLTGEIPVEVL